MCDVSVKHLQCSTAIARLEGGVMSGGWLGVCSMASQRPGAVRMNQTCTQLQHGKRSLWCMVRDRSLIPNVKSG